MAKRGEKLTPIRRIVLAPAVEGVTYTGLRGFVVGWDGPFGLWYDRGPALVRREPVQEVSLQGPEPRYDHQRNLWAWDAPLPFEAGRLIPRSELPAELFDHLRDDVPATGSGHYWRFYRSELKAYAALNAAALRWALTPSPP